MDRAKPSLWVQVLAGCAIFSAFLIYFVFRSRIAKWIVRKHGLECPVCGKEITTVAGLAGMPHKGLCNQCGTKVIEINEPSASPKAENPA
jgi:rRNA maturation endonuclease Nob1